MKVAIVLLSLTALALAESPFDHTAYGYLTRLGAYEAKRIRAQEEEYLRNPVSRIFNGSPASLGQFPYQAGLVITLRWNTAVCGAILLNQNRLLTAAHCWFDGQNQALSFVVVLGSITLFSGGTRIQTNNIVMHPNWTPNIAANDIAMIRLPLNVQYSSFISPAILPSGSQMNQDYVGQQAVASGYGAHGNNVGIANNQFLSHVTLNVIANNVCSASFPGLIQSSNICVNAQSASPCGGDSGGPLVHRNTNVLIGVVSFGAHRSIGGCQSGRPAVFARVSSFMSFINQQM